MSKVKVEIDNKDNLETDSVFEFPLLVSWVSGALIYWHRGYLKVTRIF